jgi:hypothetical protein
MSPEELPAQWELVNSIIAAGIIGDAVKPQSSSVRCASVSATPGRPMTQERDSSSFIDGRGISLPTQYFRQRYDSEKILSASNHEPDGLADKYRFAERDRRLRERDMLNFIA